MSALLKTDTKVQNTRPALAAHRRDIEAGEAAIAELKVSIATLEAIVNGPARIEADRVQAGEDAAAAIRRWADAGAKGPAPEVGAADGRLFDKDLADARVRAAAVEPGLKEARARLEELHGEQRQKAAALSKAIAAELVAEAEQIAARYVSAFNEMADALLDLIGIGEAAAQITANQTQIGPFGIGEVIRAPNFRLQSIRDSDLVRPMDALTRNGKVNEWLARSATWSGAA